MCNYVVFKLSLIIGSTRLDIVVPDKLAHVVLFDLIKQFDLINCDHRDG